MRVGTQRAGEIGSKLQIKLPLPPKIDPTVTMMTVEEKPDVTYSDLGGCKDQIEKIREGLFSLPFEETSREIIEKFRLNFSDFIEFDHRVL
jgi:ATP-dependent 26S proteasome regulatory subunit